MWSGFSNLKSSLTSLVETSGIKDVVQSTVKSVTEAVNEVAQSLSLDALQEDNAPRKALYEGLDITYLTPRLIAMTFPTFPDSRIRSRNDAGAVRALLEERHGESFMLWNCSEESYDAGFFGGRVVEVKFAGYPAPPLDMLFRLCSSIGNWLAASEQNVAVIHCMTGKGRTCTIAACVLAWLGEFSSPLPALAYVCERRSRDLHLLRVRGKHGATMAPLSGPNAAGVAPSTAGAVASGISTVGNLLLGNAGSASSLGPDPFATMPLDPIAALLCPSQQRYVRYFGLACCDGVKPRSGASATLLLRRVVIHGSVALEKLPTATTSASSTAATGPSPAGSSNMLSPSTAESSEQGSSSSSSASKVVSQHLKSAKDAAQSVASNVMTTLANVAGVDEHGNPLGNEGDSGPVDIKLLPPSQVGYRPSLQIFKGSRLVHNTLWTDSSNNPGPLEGWVSVDDGAARFSLDVPVSGDCLVRCRHISSSTSSSSGGGHDRETIWRASFHAGYILNNSNSTSGSSSNTSDPAGCSLRLSKRQLDLACDDARIDDAFTVELLFAPVEEDVTNNNKASTAALADAGTTATASSSSSDGADSASAASAERQVEGAVKLSSVADAESFNKAAQAEEEFWSRISEARSAAIGRANETKGARARALQAKLAAAKEGGLGAAAAAAAATSSGTATAATTIKPYDDALEVDPEADSDDSTASNSSADAVVDPSSVYSKQALVARIERRLKRLDADIEPSVSGRGPSLGWIIKNAPPKAAPSASSSNTSTSSKASAAPAKAATGGAATTTTIAMTSAANGSGPASRRDSLGPSSSTSTAAAPASANASTASATKPAVAGGASSSSSFDKDLADLEELERELGIGNDSSAASGSSSGTSALPASAPASAAKPASTTAGTAGGEQQKAAEEEEDVVDELEKYLNL
jgi:trimeric autotransporter adhesin